MVEVSNSAMRMGVEMLLPFVSEKGEIFYADVALNFFPYGKYIISDDQTEILQQFLLRTKETASKIEKIYKTSTCPIKIQKLINNINHVVPYFYFNQTLDIILENISFISAWFSNCTDDFRTQDAIVFLTTKIQDCLTDGTIKIQS